MEFLVLSDSHGNPERLTDIYKRQIKKPDGIFFLGDGLRDLDLCDFSDTPVYCVRGNCDFFSFDIDREAKDERIEEVRGYKVMLSHGHLYGVKHSLGKILHSAAQKGADILLFGHTHIPYEHVYTPERGEIAGLQKTLYVMNPGAVGGYVCSFGCIGISDGGQILLSHGAL